MDKKILIIKVKNNLNKNNLKKAYDKAYKEYIKSRDEYWKIRDLLKNEKK